MGFGLSPGREGCSCIAWRRVGKQFFERRLGRSARLLRCGGARCLLEPAWLRPALGALCQDRVATLVRSEGSNYYCRVVSNLVCH